MAPALFAFNSRALSKFSYVGQFFDPTEQVLRDIDRGLAIATRSPLIALPTEMLHHPKALGYPTQVHSIAEVCMAAKVRVVMSSTRCFQRLFDRARMIIEGDDDNVTISFHMTVPYDAVI